VAAGQQQQGMTQIGDQARVRTVRSCWRMVKVYPGPHAGGELVQRGAAASSTMERVKPGAVC
jgi:hypothetical protein